MKNMLIILFAAIALGACKKDLSDQTIAPYNEPEMDTVSAGSTMEDTTSTTEPVIRKNAEDGGDSGL